MYCSHFQLLLFAWNSHQHEKHRFNWIQQVTDSANQEFSSFGVWKNKFVSLVVCVGSCSCCRMKCLPMSLQVFALDASAHFRIHSAAAISSYIIDDHQWSEPVPVVAEHAKHPHHCDSQVRLWIAGSSFDLHTFLLPSLYYKWIFVLSVLKTFLNNTAGSFRLFLANCNLAILFLKLTSGLNLAV